MDAVMASAANGFGLDLRRTASGWHSDPGAPSSGPTLPYTQHPPLGLKTWFFRRKTWEEASMQGPFI
jgi:hypothetical protein